MSGGRPRSGVVEVRVSGSAEGSTVALAGLVGEGEHGHVIGLIGAGHARGKLLVDAVSQCALLLQRRGSGAQLIIRSLAQSFFQVSRPQVQALPWVESVAGSAGAGCEAGIGTGKTA